MAVITIVSIVFNKTKLCDLYYTIYLFYFFLYKRIINLMILKSKILKICLKCVSENYFLENNTCVKCQN